MTSRHTSEESMRRDRSRLESSISCSACPGYEVSKVTAQQSLYIMTLMSEVGQVTIQRDFDPLAQQEQGMAQGKA